MNGHKRDLLRNIHGNSKLQRFYNKYGRLSLTFEILEFCDKNVLNEKGCSLNFHHIKKNLTKLYTL